MIKMVKKGYNEIEDLNKDMAHFIIKAITNHTLKETSQPIYTHVKGWEDLNKGENGIDVKYIVDGIELDFFECWKDYEEAWNKGVKKQAKKMIEDKVWDMFDGLRDKANILEKYMKEKIDELFPDLIDEDDGY